MIFEQQRAKEEEKRKKFQSKQVANQQRAQFIQSEKDAQK